MSLPVLDSATAVFLTFIVIGIGYVSLFLGYIFARKQKEFLSETIIKPTDKIIISFLIGGFSFINLSYFLPKTIAVDLSSMKVAPLAEASIFVVILVSSFALIIYYFVRKK